MSRRFINQLRENESVVEIYQITDRFLRPNKNGNLYLQFTISDRTGTMEGRLWNAGEEILAEVEIGDYATIEGTIQRFQGNLQLIAKKLSKKNPEKLNLNDFQRGGQVDVAGLSRRLQEILHGLSSPELLNLADTFLADDNFMTKFCERPAGVKLHHAARGGLLEHTVRMMELALAVANVYGKKINRDLLVLGAFLHDIGKTEELSVAGGFAYTDAGQILGHPYLGAEILGQKIAEAERLTGQAFDPETVLLLKHLVLAHHGTYENGAIRVPMTLEALALFYIDSLDAKLAEFYKNMVEDPNSGSHWTNYIAGLERKLYKGKREKNSDDLEN